MPKLTDTHLIILAAAAKREDGAVLPLPKKLKLDSHAAATVFQELLKKRLIADPTRALQTTAITGFLQGVGNFLSRPGSLNQGIVRDIRHLAAFTLRVLSRPDFHSRICRRVRDGGILCRRVRV